MVVLEEPLICIIYNKRTKRFTERPIWKALYTLNYFDEVITHRYYKETIWGF